MLEVRWPEFIALEKQYQPHVIVWDMNAVPDIEYSALQALIEGEKHLTELGASLWLAGLNPGVLEMVRRAVLDEKLGSERMLFNAHTAIERFQAREPTQSSGLDAHSLRGCHHRRHRVKGRPQAACR